LPCCFVLSQGRVVSFKNTLVLLTSNIGSRVIAASSGGGLAVFGSQRSLMGGGDEAGDALSKSDQVGQRPGSVSMCAQWLRFPWLHGWMLVLAQAVVAVCAVSP
jgi:hypothetical protein